MDETSNKYCDCLESTVKELLKRFPKWKNKPVEKYAIAGKFLSFETGKWNYSMVIDIMFENQKKTGTTYVIMRYCPLCGKKLPE